MRNVSLRTMKVLRDGITRADGGGDRPILETKSLRGGSNAPGMLRIERLPNSPGHREARIGGIQAQARGVARRAARMLWTNPPAEELAKQRAPLEKVIRALNPMVSMKAELSEQELERIGLTLRDAGDAARILCEEIASQANTSPRSPLRRVLDDTLSLRSRLRDIGERLGTPSESAAVRNPAVTEALALRAQLRSMSVEEARTAHLEALAQKVPELLAMIETCSASGRALEQVTPSMVEEVVRLARARVESKTLTYEAFVGIAAFAASLPASTQGEALTYPPLVCAEVLGFLRGQGPLPGFVSQRIAHFPNYIFVPTTATLEMRDFLEVEGTGIAFVGVIDHPADVDGRTYDPYGFFDHDLQHADLMRSSTESLLSSLNLPIDEAREIWRGFNQSLVRLMDRLPAAERRAAEYMIFELFHEQNDRGETLRAALGGPKAMKRFTRRNRAFKGLHHTQLRLSDPKDCACVVPKGMTVKAFMDLGLRMARSLLVEASRQMTA
jgi:hypothetical protein